MLLKPGKCEDNWQKRMALVSTETVYFFLFMWWQIWQGCWCWCYGSWNLVVIFQHFQMKFIEVFFWKFSINSWPLYLFILERRKSTNWFRDQLNSCSLIDIGSVNVQASSGFIFFLYPTLHRNHHHRDKDKTKTKTKTLIDVGSKSI